MNATFGHKSVKDSTHKAYRLRFEPDGRQCGALRRRLRGIALAAGFPNAAIEELLLGVGEAFTNAIRHGKCGGGDKIIVTISPAPSQMEVDLHYRGDGFCHELPDCDTICQLENGGLGRFIMYHVLDEVTYTFFQGFTDVKLVKRAADGDIRGK